MPPLVAWAAVTGGLSGTAFYLFAIVFFWTPPHFWALSLLMKDEYAKAGIPMLPVVRGEAETRRQILLYTVLLYAVTQLPFCAGGFGVVYLVASMRLGAGFIYCAVRLLRSADRRWALRTYLYSLAYLALLFVAMPLDRLVSSRNPAVDRETARANMGAGLLAGGIAAARLRPLLRRRHPLHRLMSPRAPPHPRARRAGLPAPLLLGAGVFAFALALTVCGIFAEGFMVRGWIYSIIGGVIALFALRAMIRDAIRELLPACPASSTSAAPCSRSRQISPQSAA